MTQHQLESILEYEPNTGLFTWRENIGCKIRAGSIAGSTRRDNGRVMIKISGTTYQASRLAFLYMTGSDVPKGLTVAYKDRNRSNLTWDNLIAVSRTNLNHNYTEVYSNTETDTRGITINGNVHKNKYTARLWNGKKKKYNFVGNYPTIEEAQAALTQIQE